MKTLILTVGLPRSGKSTWAREQGHPIVNPDSIRLALHGQPFVASAEPEVWRITRLMVNALFHAGHDTVILDATSVTRARREEWRSTPRVDDLGLYVPWTVRYEVFETPVEECVVRARLSGRYDLIPVIERMAIAWEPV